MQPDIAMRPEIRYNGKADKHRKSRNTMKRAMNYVYVWCMFVLICGVLSATQTYREGKVYQTRSSIPEPAVEPAILRSSSEDKIVVNENPEARAKPVEDKTNDRKTAAERVRRTVKTEEENSVEKQNTLTSRKNLRSTRSSASRVKGERRDKIDFVDNDNDGYDDRKNVNDL